MLADKRYYKEFELPDHIHQDIVDSSLYYSIDWTTLERTDLDIEQWYQFQKDFNNKINPCDCGGWSCGTHSHWCSNKLDNRKRPKGIEDKRNWIKTDIHDRVRKGRR